MIKVLVVDDHPLIRRGLQQIIGTCDDMEVAAEAGSGAEVLELARNSQFDILLLDINVPGPSGAELIKHLCIEHPELPILILSMHNEGQIVRRQLAAGASGYISKSSDLRILPEAIRKITGGGRFVDPALVEATVFGSETSEPSLNILTQRELLVLRLIAAGQPISTIAQKLYLSPKTVSTHKMRLMKKLRIGNNVELVLFAHRRRLVDAALPATVSSPVRSHSVRK